MQPEDFFRARIDAMIVAVMGQYTTGVAVCVASK